MTEGKAPRSVAIFSVFPVIDGQRTPRSYTTASSPTQRHYCELTIKREEEGEGVSKYLWLPQPSQAAAPRRRRRIRMLKESAPGVETPGYFQESLRDKNHGLRAAP